MQEQEPRNKRQEPNKFQIKNPNKEMLIFNFTF